MTSTVYLTGTVSVTNGNAVVTGAGTAWAVSLVTGGVFSSAGVAVPILSVESDTSLTLAYPWPGTTAAGATYAIDRTNSDAANVVDLYDRLSRVLVTLSLVGIHPNDSGTIAKRDAIVLTTDDENFLFLHAEIGVAFAFYRWTGTAWTGPFPVANAIATGGVSSIAAGAGITVDNTNPAIPVIAGAPAASIHAATGKATPVDADELGIADSAATFGLKKLTWANLKATLWTSWGALINAGTGKTTLVDADLFAIADSAATNATKKLTWANLKAALRANLFLREVLSANRTYYVRSDGSDANTGLVNNAGGAFLTLQKAIDVVAALDISIYNVTIQAADGTYTGGVSVSGAWVGSGNVTLVGNVATPANALMNITGNAIFVASGGRLLVGGFKLVCTGVGIWARAGGVCTIVGLMDFGTCSSYHMYATDSGIIQATANWNVTGGAVYSIAAQNSGIVNVAGRTAALSGVPAFSGGFVNASLGGLILINSFTFTGTATGSRYSITSAGICATFSGNAASYFPGNSNGSVSGVGSQYF
ncbi:hypothetical protein NKJ66_01100 [Mesorhizobium sp. M0078]|uniref:hypothetical protein n=1 Tax=Mesorhizobium sp. M0078 TaxID=2956871 RepID=UPI00333C8DBD